MRKRVLSFILSIVMVVSCIPNSFADNIGNVTKTDVENKLVETKIDEENSTYKKQTTTDNILRFDDQLSNEEDYTKSLAEKPNKEGKYVISLNKVSVTTSPMTAFRRVPASNKNTVKKRYTVIIMDTSGKHVLNTIYKFLDSFENECPDMTENYFSILPVLEEILHSSHPSKNIKQIKKSLSYTEGILFFTDTNNMLMSADEILSGVPDGEGVSKNIIILSGGFPQSKDKYSNFSELAEDCYNTAKKLKNKGYNIYTIGFLKHLSVEDKNFARRFLSELSSFFKFYDVENPNDIVIQLGDKSDIITDNVGKFKYPGTVGGKDNEDTYYYRDSYFYNSSYNYNPHLATMSLCLELSSWPSNEQTVYKNKTINAENLLRDIGFCRFEKNSFYEKEPTVDSIGAVIASKVIKVGNKPYTLVALAIRGGGYKSEWANNFKMGSKGYHEGFSNARNNVKDFLKDYIERNNITGNIKLWITGYSRAGGTANLLSGMINEGKLTFKNCTFNLSDVYTYTFEAPQGANKTNIEIINGKEVSMNVVLNDKKYDNIFNILNVDDFVPYLAPSEWNFGRYGIDKLVPDKSSSAYNKTFNAMLSKFKKFQSTKNITYNINKFKLNKFSYELGINRKETNILNDVNSQGDFLAKFFNKVFARVVGTRKAYVDIFQDGVVEFLALINKLDDSNKIKFITGVLGDIISTITIEFMNGTKLSDLLNGENNNLELIVENALTKNLKLAGISDISSEKLSAMIKPVVDLLEKMIFDYTDYLATIHSNNTGIVQAHYPEVCLAWMQSMDSNYTSGGYAIFSSGKGTTIKINCPVDMEIYNNEDNSLVAQIIDDKVIDVGSERMYGINEDGEKMAYLPSDAGFTVKIKATGEGTLNYSIIEDYVLIGVVRVVNYYDIPIKNGDEFISVIPKYSDEDLEDREKYYSTRQLSLINVLENKIMPITNEFVGEQAYNANYDIKAYSEDTSKGFAFGSDFRTIGSFAKLIASPREGYKFEGWYENDVKVSSDTEYRFRVEKDRTLIAKFEVDPNYDKGKKGTDNKSTQGNNNTTNKDNNSDKLNRDKKNTSNDKNDHNAEQQKDINIIPTNQNNHYPTDIPNHWAKEYIKYSVQNKIVSGYPDNTFRPNIPATRAEFLKMIINLKGYENAKYQGKFKDVKTNDWYADIVQTGIDKGIISGYPDGTFKPNQTITRAEMISMIISLEQTQELPENEEKEILSIFDDNNQIPKWARNKIAVAVKNKLITGYNNKISANNMASRAEIVSIIYRLSNK